MSESLRESVRKRPGMYVGDVREDYGRSALLFEVLGNAVDQVLAGHCDSITLILHADGGATVCDAGLGIPKPILERALLEHHDTATLDGHRFHAHLTGAAGLGLAPVSALCARIEVDTVFEGRRLRWVHERGLPLGPIENLGASDERGTRVRLRADPEVFPFPEFPRGHIYARVEELSHLLPGVRFTVRDEGAEFVSGGMRDRLRRIAPRSNPVIAREEVVEGSHVRLALGFGPTWDATIESWVNFFPTMDGGTHVKGLVTAVRALAKTKMQKDDLQARLAACVSVIHRSVEWGQPTRTELVSREVEPLVEQVTARALKAWFDAHPEDLAQLLPATAPRP